MSNIGKPTLPPWKNMDIMNLIKLIWIFWPGGGGHSHSPFIDLCVHTWKYNTWISIMIINTTCINVIKKLWSQLDGIAIYFEFLYNLLLLFCISNYVAVYYSQLINWWLKVVVLPKRHSAQSPWLFQMWWGKTTLACLVFPEVWTPLSFSWADLLEKSQCKNIYTSMRVWLNNLI